MKKTWLAVLVALFLGITISAQAQDDALDKLRALEAALSPYVAAIEKFAAALAPLPTCTNLDSDNLRVSNLDDAVTHGAVFCREIAHDGAYLVNPGAIGNQPVIERGVQQAYDVFGLTVEGDAVERFNDPITVCLKGRGEMIYLPAFASPRPAQTPQSYPDGEFTCAQLGSSGIVALVEN